MNNDNSGNNALEVLRHSTAHILAAAVTGLFPETRVAIGPAIDDGFYYDFERSTPFTPEDLEKIEDKMRHIVKAGIPFVRSEMSRQEALDYFKARGEKYKVEIIEDLTEDTVSIYTTGDFVDLCRGPHISSTGKAKYFKLLSVAGAYWRGDEKREQLQRIYGTVFMDRQELDAYLARIEEAKKRDHRRLGKELNLFSFSEEVGPGLVLWHPKGARVRLVVEDFWRARHLANGYDIVFTPHVGRGELWNISGHLDFYKDNMYSPMDVDGQDFFVKPMNCPFHIMMYKSSLYSYRDLPLRWAELGTVYRYEKSGVLHGLLRVRGFTQDDAHIICAPDQMPDEIRRVLRFCLDMLNDFGFTDFKVYLATKPKEKSVGDETMWNDAIKALEAAVKAEGLECEVDEGGGAFYGPKIDIKIKDALNREWQCSTIQFDFNEPDRFDMSYVDSSGNKVRPYMIHRALLGSIERFFGVLIEHFGGAFPFWLAPVQICVMNITDSQLDYVRELGKKLTSAGYRVFVDDRNAKIGLKIRENTMQKIPFIVVAGDREKEANSVSVRGYPGKDLGVMTFDAFVELLSKEHHPR